MAHPYHHALSSVRHWGGTTEDYLALHTWFDESKLIIADYRHRALRHHAEGIFMSEKFFGATLTLSTGKVIPTRWVGEQHVREDLGRIPSFADWARAIRPEPWMGRASKLGIEPSAATQNGNDIDMQQQINVQATLTLSLPAAWSEDEIATHIRTRLGAAFSDNLPGEINGESPVNFTFQEEAEIYGNQEPPRRRRKRIWRMDRRKSPARKRVSR
jgi:hypothetical protein